MSNLVKRLRMDIEPSEGDMEDAADLIEAQADRIAELEAALATARREGLEEAAQDLEGRAKMLRSFNPDSVGAHWAWHCAAAIRAMLEGGEDE